MPFKTTAPLPLRARALSITKRLALAALTLASLSSFSGAASAQWVNARIKGDDQFKVYLSTDPNNAGVLMSQAIGWSLQQNSRFFLYGTQFNDYYINVWVQDVGGSIAGFVGDFKITQDPQQPRNCRFDNNTNNMNTNTTHWKATPSLAQSTTWNGAPGGFGSSLGALAFNNSLPTNFQTPTLQPFDLGSNTAGGSPWQYFANSIDPAARYLNNPSNDSTPGSETWYSVHIHCQ